MVEMVSMDERECYVGDEHGQARTTWSGFFYKLGTSKYLALGMIVYSYEWSVRCGSRGAR